MREIFARNYWIKRGGFLVATILIFVAIGPFGSYSALSLPMRLAFWTFCILGVAVPMETLIPMAVASPRLSHLPRALRIALGSAAAAVPGAMIVMFVGLVLHLGFKPETFPRTWMQVTMLGFVIGMVRFNIDLGDRPESASQPAEGAARAEYSETALAEPAPLPAFVQRLDPSLGSDLVSLSMQDHYVEVTTTQGRTMVLIRMSDALKELETAEGMQVHRSHWAALPHVEALVRERGRTRLQLSDGRRLPVSQTYEPALRAALAARGIVTNV